MKLSIFVILSIIPIKWSFSQDIKSKFFLENIYLAKNIALNEIRVGRPLKLTQFGSYIIYYSPDKNNRINQLTFLDTGYNATDIKCILPDSIDVDYRSIVHNISITASCIFIFYYNGYILFNYNLNKRSAVFIKRVNLTKKYNNYYLQNDSILICSQLYNTGNTTNDVYVSKYIVGDSYPVKTVYPKFDCIELSHFQPNHWLDISSSGVFLSMACSYKIYWYNHDLVLVDSLERNITGWDNILSDTVYKSIKGNSNPHAVISKLSYINDYKGSKVEGVWGMGDIVLLRYCLHSQGEDSFTIAQRYYDIYKLDRRTSHFMLLDTCLMDAGLKLQMEDTVTRYNTYLMSWNYNSFFLNNHLVIVKPTADISYLNSTLRHIFRKQKEYFEKKKPYVGLWFFRLKL